MACFYLNLYLCRFELKVCAYNVLSNRPFVSHDIGPFVSHDIGPFVSHDIGPFVIIMTLGHLLVGHLLVMTLGHLL